jgi:hypothetical protein
VNLKTPRQLVPTAPSEYRKDYLDQVVRAVNLFIGDALNPGDLVGSSLMIINPAESGYGLRVNAVYVDESGFLRMVRPADTYAPTNRIRVKLGTVEVSIT